MRHPDNKEADHVRTLIDRISPILRGQDREFRAPSSRICSPNGLLDIVSLMIGSRQFSCVAGYSTST
jgi:hypothetical protein